MSTRDGVLYDATIPYDARFFESLDRVVQAEPWLQRDRAMIDTLRTIGIEKGKPFAPDAGMREALDEAAARRPCAARREVRSRYSRSRWVEGSRWAFPAAPAFVEAVQSHYADPNVYPVDDRGLLFTYIFFTPKRLGEGQFYLMVIDDKAGSTFDGSKTYRLNVPGQRAGKAVLVGNCLRPPDACPDPRNASRRPLVAEPRAAVKRRRLG